MITIHKISQGSQEWLKLRETHITASHALLLLKKGVNACLSSNKAGFGGNYYTKRGHILEQQSQEIFEQVYDLPTINYGFVTNDKYTGCGASPDWVVPMQAVAENKSYDKEKHLACIKELPNDVYCQTQFNMMLLELDIGYPCFYNPDIDNQAKCFKRFTVYKDSKLINCFKVALYGY